jgi:hypothetical protein
MNISKKNSMQTLHNSLMDTMEYARSQVGIAMGSAKEGINGRRQRK